MIIFCLGKDELSEITILPDDLFHISPSGPPAVEPEPLVGFFTDNGRYPRMEGTAEVPDRARFPALGDAVYLLVIIAEVPRVDGV